MSVQCTFCGNNYRVKADLLAATCSKGKKCVPKIPSRSTSGMCQFRAHSHCLKTEEQGSAHCKCQCHEVSA